MQIYNSLTKQKEEFQPINPPEVKFYHCGPTVYWTQHIGNLRGMTMGDLIRRSLEYLGYDVDYVRNYTDVGHLTSDSDEGEDKMEKGAKREGKTPEEIADKYIKIFENDIKEINLLEPTHKAKVTSHIDDIIEMIKILLDRKAAYITQKAVYFDVTKAKDYPAFSNKKLEDQIEGAGTGDVTDADKKNPADFALWFFKTGAHKNALQTWESPFNSPAEDVENGRGFPGWHIECSVIAKEFLGKTLDIHMGGIEHKAIHHPNEIAQSETANNAPFSKYWIHNEHLTVNGAKMSKSEGTGFSLVEIKEKGFDPMDLRYFFLQAHYRSKQNFTWEALGAARKARLKLISKLWSVFNNTNGANTNINKDWKDKFTKALKDDINIPQALAIIWEILKKPDEKTYSTIIDFDRVMGLKLEDSDLKDSKPSSKEQINSIEIDKLVEKREQARKDKDFAEADRIRDQLDKEFGVVVEDTSEGSVWNKKDMT